MQIVAEPQRGPNITRTMGRKIDFDTNDEKKRNFFLVMMFVSSLKAKYWLYFIHTTVFES